MVESSRLVLLEYSWTFLFYFVQIFIQLQVLNSIFYFEYNSVSENLETKLGLISPMATVSWLIWLILATFRQMIGGWH